MSKFWSSRVKELVPYVPGEQPKMANLVKLNTNENPFGPSPKVIEAINTELNDSLRLYPDPESEALKSTIAKYYGVQGEQVFLGNGSDEVLAHIFYGLFQHGEPVLYPDITYSFYPVYCGLYNIEGKTVPLTDSFEIDPKDYKQPNGGIIFPNPNAPTGRYLALDKVEAIVAANPDRVVVVDEAYVDFGGECDQAGGGISQSAGLPNAVQGPFPGWVARRFRYRQPGGRRSPESRQEQL